MTRAPDAAFETGLAWVQPRLLALLREGRHLAIHCHGGSGRTGLAGRPAADDPGAAPQEAMTLIRAGRPRAFTLACHRHWLDTRGRRLAEAD